eukprot:CAMPEP_0114506276 /NCGR_PEP_ID=MMETSP0109-20121206/11339_1 /TAXON_ID=29199 /ORGANISM="Chlorarachnion reptans, Strain CCCM449" /LENGTH=293 /DNA_ID=CAMNT_0001684849 /DNA_START=137 /DNA_END=1018 /DNA_ORIENTATION=-
MLVVFAVAVLALLAAVFFILKKPNKAFGDGKRPVALHVALKSKEQVSHDTIRLRFALPNESDVLGLPCGKHFTVGATVNGSIQSRAYTPTSDGMRTKGYTELVIKVYKPTERFPKGGIMSQHIDSLKIGDTIKIRGPMGRIHYQGKGVFDVRGKGRMEAKSIGMISGGTGITPMLQLIQEIVQDPEDNTKIYLLFANKSVDDILVRDYLEKAKKQATKAGKTFNLWYTVDKAPKDIDWKYSEGFVSKDMIAKHMPSPGENPVMLFCGPPIMNERAVKPNLDELKYDESRCLNF